MYSDIDDFRVQEQLMVSETDFSILCALNDASAAEVTFTMAFTYLVLFRYILSKATVYRSKAYQ